MQFHFSRLEQGVLFATMARNWAELTSGTVTMVTARMDASKSGWTPYVYYATL